MPAGTMQPCSATILLVDDDPQIVRALRPALEVNGLDVTVASCGRAAMEHAERSAWHAAIVDLGLPDMDGRQIIRYLTEERDTPVIVISAQDFTVAANAAGRAVVDFFQKPFRTPELVDRLRQLLAQASHS